MCYWGCKCSSQHSYLANITRNYAVCLLKLIPVQECELPGPAPSEGFRTLWNGLEAVQVGSCTALHLSPCRRCPSANPTHLQDRAVNPQRGRRGTGQHGCFRMKTVSQTEIIARGPQCTQNTSWLDTRPWLMETALFGKELLQ